jgi:NADH:ubiquinone oxidoreductase subunit K
VINVLYIFEQTIYIAGAESAIGLGILVYIIKLLDQV